MKLITDNIYGKVRIKEPILLELLKSPSILRLKDISQYGIPDEYYHLKNYSRYEHSVGVMILLRKLGAALEEQVAGLLHDVSVSAFSHIADWVFGEGKNGREDFHDSIHQEFVVKTEIPKILKRFGFSIERILNEESFKLLENKIPDLCADRVDYALREFKYWLNPKIANRTLKALINFNGEIVFNNKKDAFDFAINFLELQTQHWGGYEAILRYHLFSRALKIALKEKVIQQQDFYKEEKNVLDKLEKSQNKKLREILSILRKKDLRELKRNSKQNIVKKFRFVDPKILLDDHLIRLSKISLKFQKILENHRKINEKGFFV